MTEGDQVSKELIGVVGQGTTQGIITGQTLQLLIKAAYKQMSKPTAKAPQLPYGYLSRREGFSHVLIRDRDLKDFQNIARKMRVGFSLQQDKSGRTLATFRANDRDRIMLVMKRIAEKALSPKKTSILNKIKDIQARQKQQRNKERVRDIPWRGPSL